MTPTGDFSHEVTVCPWPEDGVSVQLTATAAEREALRTRFGLVELASLDASLGIEQDVTEFVLKGTIAAVVAQNCVVTLQPITSSLEVPFERRYRRRDVQEKLAASDQRLALDEDMIDIDILDGDTIDIGEAIAEEFYLALDPYPRSVDADQALKEIKAKTESRDQPANPFEKLRRH